MDDDLLELYSQRLMAHGRRVAADKRLEAPHLTIFRRSPLCGSTVTLDIELDGDRVKALGYAVRACSLGQVGGSVLVEALPGPGLAEARAVREAGRVTLDVDVGGVRGQGLGYAGRACSLGEVGVSVLVEALPGQGLAEARAVMEAVRAMLTEGASAPSGPWADLELLEPARDLKNRHGSALLPFEAVVEGLEQLAEGRG